MKKKIQNKNRLPDRILQVQCRERTLLYSKETLYIELEREKVPKGIFCKIIFEICKEVNFKLANEPFLYESALFFNKSV